MDSVKKGLDAFLKWMSVILFAALVIIVAWQVISRTAGSPSTWAEEAARYSFVWLGFFAAALVFSEKGHIAVDFLVRRQPLAAQKVTAIISQLAIAALAVLVFIWGGIRASARAWNQQLSSLPATVGAMYLVMPITGVFILVFAIHHLIQIATDQQAPYAPDDDDEAVTSVVAADGSPADTVAGAATAGDAEPDGGTGTASDPDDPAQTPTRGEENL